MLMTDFEDKLKKKFEGIRMDLKYYQQMSAEEYINDRLLFKIKLYYYFGRRNKRLYGMLAVLAIIAGLLVPLSLVLDLLYSKGYATFLSLFTGGIISLEATVFNFKEKFKSYKKTEDQLTNELILFQTKTEPYFFNVAVGEDKALFRLLVSRVESIILKERDDTIEKITRMSLEQMKVK
jgi:hypothetical protein